VVKRYLIDSSAVSKYLEERFPETGLQFMDDLFGQESLISVITQIELLSWNPADRGLENKVATFVEDSVVPELSEEIILETIRLRRKQKIKTPNAIIAATALVYGRTVVTDNERDFDNIKELKWINPTRL
jgi:predicted nucleic acid-binding protein